MILHFLGQALTNSLFSNFGLPSHQDMNTTEEKELSWKEKWYVIIFQHHTKQGRRFDELLLILILLSVLVVFVDSMQKVAQSYRLWLLGIEWLLTLIFTAEYIVRIMVVPRKRSYILSFYGIIDLLSIVPTYLSIFLAGSQFLIIIRVLRLIRVFRIMKLYGFTKAGVFLIQSLRNAKEKILVFFGAVLLLVVVVGTIMYLVEGPESGFTSIPTSIYWAIVTITTVGYGDISPESGLGQFIASILMLTGYAIIAVPTGILTAEISKKQDDEATFHANHECGVCGHKPAERKAKYCSNCGNQLPS